MFASCRPQILFTPRSEAGLGVAPNVKAAEHMRDYIQARHMRLEVLKRLKVVLESLPEDAGQKFANYYKSEEFKPSRQEAVGQIVDALEIYEEQFKLRDAGIRVCVNPAMIKLSPLIDCPPDGIQIELEVSIAKLGKYVNPRWLLDFVKTTIDKLSRYIQKSSLSGQSPILYMPMAMNVDILNYSILGRRSFFQLQLNLAVIGAQLADLAPNEASIAACHKEEISDPGAGGCEVRRQALAQILPEKILPFLKDYIDALHFKILFLNAINYAIAKSSSKKQTSLEATIPVPKDADLDKIRLATQQRLQKLNREIGAPPTSWQFKGEIQIQKTEYNKKKPPRGTYWTKVSVVGGPIRLKKKTLTHQSRAAERLSYLKNPPNS